MELTPEERQRIEQREQARVKKEMYGYLVGLLIVVALLGFVFLNSVDNNSKQSGTDSSTISTTSEIEVGSEAYLYQGSQTAFVAIDEDALSEFQMVVTARDKIGFAELLQQGRVLTMPAGTKVLVLRKGLAVKVRILEGVYAGRAMWTDLAWISRNKQY